MAALLASLEGPYAGVVISTAVSSSVALGVGDVHRAVTKALPGVRLAFSSLSTLESARDCLRFEVGADAAKALFEAREKKRIEREKTAAGFREAGADGAELERRVVEELARHDGLRLLGPNCVGLIA